MDPKRATFELPHGTFHALQVGDPAAKPLLFLHGFPDHPLTAATFLAELAERGHHALAPWLRGYAPSPTAGPFDVGSLLDDVGGFLDRLEPERPVDIVGHDWGAALTYAACIAAPGRVRRAVTIAVPHPLTFLRQARSPSQLRRSWYMALLQLPGAGRLVAARELALIDRLWSRWSPGFALDPGARAELHACLAASMPGPISYYRAMAAPRTAVPLLRSLARPIGVPLLQLHGADDGCVLPPRGDDGHRFSAPRELEIVPGAGHFLHLEAPVATAERIARWLG